MPTDVTIQATEQWVSPGTGGDYGVVWRVQEETLDLDLGIRARYADQEILLFSRITPTYPGSSGKEAPPSLDNSTVRKSPVLATLS